MFKARRALRRSHACTAPRPLAPGGRLPCFSDLRKQLLHPSFATRVAWEKRARVLFARTVRAHMRASNLFSADNVWDAEDAALADLLVNLWRVRRDLDVGALCDAFTTEHAQYEDERVRLVWSRLQKYPHCFELAAVRGSLDALASDGSLPDASVPAPVRPGRLTLAGFHVNVADVEDFLAGEVLTDSFLQLLLMLVRSVWPSETYVYPPWLVANRKVSLTLPRFLQGAGSKVRSLSSLACFPHLLDKPRAWVVFWCGLVLATVLRRPSQCSSRPVWTSRRCDSHWPTCTHYSGARMSPSFRLWPLATCRSLRTWSPPVSLEVPLQQTVLTCLA